MVLLGHEEHATHDVRRGHTLRALDHLEAPNGLGVRVRVLPVRLLNMRARARRGGGVL